MRMPSALIGVLLAATAVAGCAAGPVASPGATTAMATAPAASPTPMTSPMTPPSTAPSTAAASSSPLSNPGSTPDDESIARLIAAAAEQAIPELKALNDSDPSKLEKLFLPLGVWIASQKAAVTKLTPNCTSAAVERFIEGLDRYDAIRKKFLAWRDWGALGNAFPPGAPREAADSLRQALAELDAHCPD